MELGRVPARLGKSQKAGQKDQGTLKSVSLYLSLSLSLSLYISLSISISISIYLSISLSILKQPEDSSIDLLAFPGPPGFLVARPFWLFLGLPPTSLSHLEIRLQEAIVAKARSPGGNPSPPFKIF